VVNMLKPIAFVIFMHLSCVAMSAAQLGGPDSTVDSYLQVWNRHDMAGLERILAADADWVMTSGTRLRGRTAIQAALAREHSTWAKSTTMTASGTTVRLLGNEVAIVSFDWEIISVTDTGGQTPGSYRGVSVFVVVKNGGKWQIVSGQATNARSAK